jgi:hypothetical protein
VIACVTQKAQLPSVFFVDKTRPTLTGGIEKEGCAKRVKIAPSHQTIVKGGG